MCPSSPLLFSEIPTLALSIKDLQEIMSPLSELGKGESTFEVNGLAITVRNLTPDEEIQTQRYARNALTEGDANDQINALDYLDRFRTICLGYAIVQIGAMDFRGVTTIETGEKLPNGVAVKVKKHEAIMKVVESWSRPMTVAVFQRLTSLLEKIESDVEKSLKFDEDNKDAEIARLEEKLTELRASKAKTEAGANDPRGLLIDAAANKPSKPNVPASPTSTEGGERVTWETARVNRTTDEAPTFLDMPSDIPKSLVEDSVGVILAEVGGAAPTEVQAPPVEAEPEHPAPVQDRKPVFGNRPPVRHAAEVDSDPLKDIQSSLVDVSDANVIEAENQRLMADRARRMAPVPPHLSAREVAQSIEKAGTIDGLDVYKMPVQNLDRTVVPRPTHVVTSNTNPNFRPAK